MSRKLEDKFYGLKTHIASSRDLSYLKKLRPDIVELSKKHNIPEDLALEMIDELFVDIRSLIASPKAPMISLTYFGVFKPKLDKLNKLLRRLIKMSKSIRRKFGQDISEKQANVIKKVRLYWAVKQRLIAEKRGIKTWFCWRDLPEDLTGYEECLKPTSRNCQKCQ